ncbi:MAG: hypothetical protein WCQ99_17095 [Pseudomonadota bacterium]
MNIADIRTNLKAALGAIRTRNGFANDIGSVSDEFVYSETTAYPALVVVIGDIIFNDKAGNYCEVQLKVNIYALVKNLTAPQTELLSVTNDIYKCLAADPHLTAACMWIRPLRAATAGDVFNLEGCAPGFSPPHGCMRVECEALYRFYRPDGI